MDKLNQKVETRGLRRAEFAKDGPINEGGGSRRPFLGGDDVGAERLIEMEITKRRGGMVSDGVGGKVETAGSSWKEGAGGVRCA